MFADRSRWSLNIDNKSDQNPFWFIATWVLRHMYAYNYLTAYESEQSVSLFTAAQRTNLQNWCEAYAEFILYLDGQQYDSMFTNRSTYAVSGEGASFTSAGQVRYRDASGQRERVRKLSVRHNNRSARSGVFLGMVGVLFDNQTYRDAGIRFVKEGLRYGCFPDGSVSDFERSVASEAEPTKGWKYSCEYVGMLLTFAHALWVSGDDQLFTESTTDGVGQSAGTPAKTLKSAALGLLHHVDDTYVRYVGDGNLNDDDRIKPGGPASNSTTKRRYNDIVVGPIIDTYLQAIGDPDADVARDLYMRYAPNTYPQPAPPIDSATEIEGGASGLMPGVLFCFGRTN